MSSTGFPPAKDKFLPLKWVREESAKRILSYFVFFRDDDHRAMVATPDPWSTDVGFLNGIWDARGTPSYKYPKAFLDSARPLYEACRKQFLATNGAPFTPEFRARILFGKKPSAQKLKKLEEEEKKKEQAKESSASDEDLPEEEEGEVEEKEEEEEEERRHPAPRFHGPPTDWAHTARQTTAYYLGQDLALAGSPNYHHARLAQQQQQQQQQATSSPLYTINTTKTTTSAPFVSHIPNPLLQKEDVEMKEGEQKKKQQPPSLGTGTPILPNILGKRTKGEKKEEKARMKRKELWEKELWEKEPPIEISSEEEEEEETRKKRRPPTIPNPNPVSVPVPVPVPTNNLQGDPVFKGPFPKPFTLEEEDFSFLGALRRGAVLKSLGEHGVRLSKVEATVGEQEGRLSQVEEGLTKLNSTFVNLRQGVGLTATALANKMDRLEQRMEEEMRKMTLQVNHHDALFLEVDSIIDHRLAFPEAAIKRGKAWQEKNHLWEEEQRQQQEQEEQEQEEEEEAESLSNTLFSTITSIIITSFITEVEEEEEARKKKEKQLLLQKKREEMRKNLEEEMARKKEELQKEEEARMKDLEEMDEKELEQWGDMMDI